MPPAAPPRDLPTSPALESWWYFRLSEDSSFERFFFSPDQQTWLVQTKSGITTELGKPLDGAVPSAIEFGPGLNGGTFLEPPYRWYVSRKYDTSLNVVYYQWQGYSGSNRLYLVSVYDTQLRDSVGFHPSHFAHHIELTYESMSKQAIAANTVPIWRQAPTWRLNGVDVTSDVFNSTTLQRELVRRYHLAYHDAGPRSYLDSVTIEGKCSSPVFELDSAANPVLPSTSCLSRPPTTFQYEAADGSTIWNPQLLNGYVPEPSYVADVDSDGLPDFVGPPVQVQGQKQQQVAFNFGPHSRPSGGNPFGIPPNTLSGLQNITLSNTADGTTPQNFYPDPSATALAFTTGNYLGDGNINVGWFGALQSGIGGPTGFGFPVLAFTPQNSGSGWDWAEERDVWMYLTPPNPASPSTSCDNWTPDNSVFPPSWSGETPIGTGDVDGDNYPDLIIHHHRLLPREGQLPVLLSGTSVP